ncbi:MAG TPA: cbb3-type cytochrome c oxidase subunit II, partial [Chthoniobacterales bacterium]|jgi:cytochrome c oxidase cbb3-type subunit 2
MDEDGNDAYPAPKSGMADRGRRVYAANGCVYCHSQQVRADYAASDIDRKWGERRSAPRDYIFERPVLLGKMRMGPDLSNVGKRAPVEDQNAPPPSSTSPASGGAAAGNAPPASGNSPSATAPSTSNPAANAATSADVAVGPNGAPPPYTAAWHHLHLYSPRSITLDSNMPAYRFLYDKRPISGERAADALNLTGPEAPKEGWEIVPTYDAKCLVAYLLSLDQSHPLKEVKATAVPPSPPAPGKEAK